MTSRPRDDVITELELTSPDELIPARPPPAPLELDEADHAHAIRNYEARGFRAVRSFRGSF